MEGKQGHSPGKGPGWDAVLMEDSLWVRSTTLPDPGHPVLAGAWLSQKQPQLTQVSAFW